MPETDAVLIKTSLVDFPGRVAAVVFLPGCNLRCPYCYNAALVTGGQQQDGAAWVSLQDIYAHLERRRNVLSGLAISGGEPLLSRHTEPLIRHAHGLGLSVKLDTNGLVPDRLETLCADSTTRPDYIAMDIKTSPHRYVALGFAGDALPLLSRTVSCMRCLPAGSREWRTVLVPTLVTRDDIPRMAALLPEDADWFLTQFRNEGCLDESYNGISPYEGAEAEALVKAARALRPRAEMR